MLHVARSNLALIKLKTDSNRREQQSLEDLQWIDSAVLHGKNSTQNNRSRFKSLTKSSYTEKYTTWATFATAALLPRCTCRL